MARKTTYKPEYCDMVRVACRLGAIDTDLEELLGVSSKTIFNWRNKHPEFAEASKVGKEAANNKVKEALFKRATGCITSKQVLDKNGIPTDITTEHPPETAACMAWLYNRDRANWKKDPALIDDPNKKDDSNVYNITIVKPEDAANKAH